MGDDLLRAKRDQRSVLGWQRQCFVERIGVQRLAAAQNRGQRLNRHAHDVVFRLLRGKRRAGCLRVKAQQQRPLVFGREAIAHDASPEAPRGAILRDFFEQIVVRVEEEGELRSKGIDVEPGVNRGLHIRDRIRQRERNFLNGRRAGFADVVPGDRDGVPLGKFCAAPGENIGHDTHRGAHGIYVRAAGDVFLEDIVLHRAGKFRQAGALLFCNRDIQAKKNRGGGVDGHRSGNVFERNSVEKRLHVFQRINRHADFSDFAKRQRVIGIHADLCRQIESDG